MSSTNPPPSPSDTHDRLTGALYSHKAKWRDTGADIDRMIELCITATPRPEKRPTPPAIPKLPLVLFLAGATSFGIAAGYTRPEVSPVPNAHPSTALECGRDALRKGDFRESMRYYKQVCDPSPEALFGLAQCQFRLNEYDDALDTCGTLDLATGGTSWESPLVRGWIAERRGQKIMAYSWYCQSAKRGNRSAEKLAERVK